MARDERDYIVSMLKVAGTRDTNDEIIKRESVWKEKFGSPPHGLDDN